MKPINLAFVVNRIETEAADYTTTLLAHCLHRRGHRVFYLGVGDLHYTVSEKVGGIARRVPDGDYENCDQYIAALHGDKAVREPVDSEQLDIIFLRSDPGEEIGKRDWATTAGLMFGQLAVRQGIIVLNDPFGLSHALNKMYLEQFPAAVRPRSIITRHPEDIKHFAESEPGDIILKPLLGSGGTNVFVIREDDHPNLNQIIEVISQDGYVIAQEYMPKAAEGDIRLFLMNGEPLMRDGKYAAVHRKNKAGDIRSNMHAGGKAHAAEITPEILQMVELIRPKLVQDGMFLVGLDIAGDRLLEINLESPGALSSACALEDRDFALSIVEALERKVNYRRSYGKLIPNDTIATL